MSSKTHPIDPNAPDSAVIARAAGIITGGGVLIFPTQSLYGLGANALDRKAVNRIFEIKERPAGKPLLVLIDGISQLDSLVEETSSAARRIMASCWPGGVTLVFRAKPDLPVNLTAGTGKIGIRLPLHPVARELVRLAGAPITGTSANLSGQIGCSRISDIEPPLRDRVDMILDAGPLKGGPGSTVVDITVSPPRILREGLVPASRIFASLKKI
jgi:L-threonylcarbamoyladenylate synthase